MKHRIQLFDADYQMFSDGPALRLFGKKLSGKVLCFLVRGIKPYFYLESKGDLSWLKREPLVESVKKVEKKLPEMPESPREVLRVTCKSPWNVPKLREKLREKLAECKLYEADIPFVYRCLADLGIKAGWIELKGKPLKTNSVRCKALEAKPASIKQIERMRAGFKKLALDIETYSPRDRKPVPTKDPILLIGLRFSQPYKGSKQIVLLTKTASHPRIKNHQCGSEEEMLKKLASIVEEFDPDILTGYNVNGFDFPFLLSRAKELGINLDLGRVVGKLAYFRSFGKRKKTTITGRIVVDSYQLAKSELSLKSYTLKNVARNLLDKEKIDIPYEEINELWKSREGRKKLVKYVDRDAELALKLIHEKLQLDKYFALSRESGLLIQDVLDSGEAMRLENLLLQEFNKENFIIPSKPSEKKIIERKQEEKKLKGGHVFEPLIGLHEFIISLDFSSLYPSIIMTYNVCPTTLTQNKKKANEAPSGARFVKKEKRKGIIPKILKRLVAERRKVKAKLSKEKSRELDAKQLALKIMANAFYGYFGYIRARLYNLRIANAITSWGRNLIRKTKKKIDSQEGLKTIYGDTDSIMFKSTSEQIDKCFSEGKKISKEISKSLEGELQLEFEEVFRRLLIQTKKRYVGLSFQPGSKGKIVDKGIETVRRDWCDLVSDVMTKVLKLILKEGKIEQAVSYTQKELENLSGGKIEPKKLAITKSITKSLDSYKGKLPHIELAKKIKDINPAKTPSVGERISYIIKRGPGNLSARAELPEKVRKKQIDSEYYIRRQLLPPLERIFNPLGISPEELQGLGKQQKLGSYKAEPKIMDRPIKAESFKCSLCGSEFRRPPLAGCKCGGEILVSGPAGLSRKAKA